MKKILDIKMIIFIFNLGLALRENIFSRFFHCTSATSDQFGDEYKTEISRTKYTLGIPVSVLLLSLMSRKELWRKPVTPSKNTSHFHSTNFETRKIFSSHVHETRADLLIPFGSFS